MTSQPARIGPAIAARPMTGPNAANAPPISFGGKTVLMTPRPCGISSAPNAPWRTRARDEDVGRRRERARDRGEREAGDADDEDAPAAEDVAEAPADDHEDAEGERVAGGPPLHRRRAAAELGADGRGGDGDDRAVEQIHDLGDEHDREDDPAPAVGGRGSGATAGADRRRRRRTYGFLDSRRGAADGQGWRTLFVTNTVRNERRSCQVDCRAMPPSAAPRSRRERPAKPALSRDAIVAAALESPARRASRR